MGGNKAEEIDGHNHWYSSFNKEGNAVGILIDKDLSDEVVEVKHKSDRIIFMKLVIGSVILNVLSVHAPQFGWSKDITGRPR